MLNTRDIVSVSMLVCTCIVASEFSVMHLHSQSAWKGSDVTTFIFRNLVSDSNF
jgi:hypothetical protein